uniref:Uncharacterized protein n=1 Tax=Nelumbo nucifera TaxID=4432 RepID=A0A822XQV3_NELNU|nr:TPA_asm: hypothetical protein HUJ06_023516 [Nelumbo nucifera]
MHRLSLCTKQPCICTANKVEDYLSSPSETKAFKNLGFALDKAEMVVVL